MGVSRAQCSEQGLQGCPTATAWGSDLWGWGTDISLSPGSCVHPTVGFEGRWGMALSAAACRGGDGDNTGAAQGASGPYPDEVNEGVVDVGATGEEEAAARAERVEEEEFLFL